MQIEPIVVIRATREILTARGWAQRYTRGAEGPLNVRSAVSLACDLLCVADWTQWQQAYVGTIDLLREHLGTGISYWEYGATSAKSPTRTQAEVIGMLDDMLSSVPA